MGHTVDLDLDPLEVEKSSGNVALAIERLKIRKAPGMNNLPSVLFKDGRGEDLRTKQLQTI